MWCRQRAMAMAPMRSSNLRPRAAAPVARCKFRGFARLAVLLSFRNPHPSASQAGLAVFGKWRGATFRGGRAWECRAWRGRAPSSTFLGRNKPDDPNAGGQLGASTGEKRKARQWVVVEEWLRQREGEHVHWV